MASKIMRHIHEGDSKSGKLLLKLSEQSPERFQKVLQDMKSNSSPQLVVLGQDGSKVEDNFTTNINKAFDEGVKKLNDQLKHEKFEEAGATLATLAKISPERFSGMELDKLPTSVLSSAMSKLPLKEFTQQNGLLAFTLGKMILEPKSTTDPTDKSVKDCLGFIKSKGWDKPGKCGEDLWRTMTRIKVFDDKSDKPVIDGTQISKEPPAKDLESSAGMRNLLNIFFRHATSPDNKDIIPKEFQGDSQGDAHVLGEALGRVFQELNAGTHPDILFQKLEAEHNDAYQAVPDGSPQSKFDEVDKKYGQLNKITMELYYHMQFLDEGDWNAMQMMFGLGAQELFTQPANWTIPMEFRMGNGSLQVSEFSPGYPRDMAPFEYVRSISITTKENGDLEYRISQPITFKDQQKDKPMGTCRMETVLVFDSNMECKSFTQEVKPAQVKGSSTD
jgi:hypothetical protein